MRLDDVHELTEQWIATWLHIRDLTASDVDGWPLIHVASVSRETELVCVDPGVDAFEALLSRVSGDRRAMLTVVAPDIGPYRSMPLPTGVRVDRDDETLMSTTLDPAAPPRTVAVPHGFTSRWDDDGHGTTYSVETSDAVAAAGTVGVLGAVATFDRVETTPAHRRRGLGRHVMTVLSVEAAARGATHGVLAASGQGRPLYAGLGWDVRLEMLSLMGA
jgi:GNAT superfamily N-acetyltransferase